MKHCALALGLVVLSCSACGNGPSPDVVIGAGAGAGGGAGGGSSTSSGSGGAGGEAGAMSAGYVFPGTLATYPLAVTSDGQAWLFAGEYVSDGPGYPGDWTRSRLWKMDAQQVVQFEQLLDAEGYFVEPIAMEADSDGSVVLVGHVKRGAGAAKTMEIGGKAVDFPYSSAAFVAKLDPNGNHVWSKVFDADVGLDAEGLPGMLRFADVGLDALSRVYVATILRGTGDLGGGAITHDDVLILRLAENGDYLDERLVVEKDSVFVQLEVEPSGGYWLARSSFYLQSGVQHFDATGQILSEHWWPMCWVDAMAFAADGFGGYFTAWAEDPAEHCTSVTLEHISKADVSDWLMDDGSYYAVRPTLLAGSSGHAWLSMGLDGTMGNLLGKSIDDIVLAEIDQKGNVSRMETFGGVGVDAVVQMGRDGSGSRWLTGYFAESLDFGAGEIKNVLGQNRAIFLTRLGP